MTRFPIRQVPGTAKWNVIMLGMNGEERVIFTSPSRKQALIDRENLWWVFMEGWDDGRRHAKQEQEELGNIKLAS